MPPAEHRAGCFDSSERRRQAKGQGGVGKGRGEVDFFEFSAPQKNWIQKDVQLHRAKLDALVKEFEELGKEGSQFPDAPDYDDFDMLAQVHYRLGLVEAYASFDEDGTPQRQGYEAAMSAFHNAIQVRTDLLSFHDLKFANAHLEIDDAQRMQQRRCLQDCLATMIETSDNHEDWIRSRVLYTQWREVVKALDACSKGGRKSYSKDFFDSIKQHGERKETQSAIGVILQQHGEKVKEILRKSGWLRGRR
jgi:hypothetical protein